MFKHYSTPSVPSGKPSKPYPEFPLFPHATRRWAKKIRGKLHYFGYFEDGWQAALDNYNRQKDALHAGRKPRVDPESVTIKELANKFLNAKRASVDSGELAYRS